MAAWEGLAAVPTYLAGVEAESGPAPVAQNSFSSCLPDLYHSCRFTASAHITDETQIKDQHNTGHTYRHYRPPHPYSTCRSPNHLEQSLTLLLRAEVPPG